MKSAISLIWAITAGATLLQAANGLLQALLPLRMQAEGLPIYIIGVVATAYGLGFGGGCLLTPVFVSRVGHIRAFASLGAMAVAITLAMTTIGSAPAWIALRFLSGLALAGLFTIADAWTGARATSSNRGRVVSIYQIFSKTAAMISPLGVGLGSIEGSGLFMLIAALMSLSIVPVATAMAEEPARPVSVRPDIVRLLRLAPTALVAAFAVGLMNGPVQALVPIYGTSVGLPTDLAAALLFAIQGGGLLMQWPVGWLSDRIDRRKVIAGVAAGLIVASLFMLWSSDEGTTQWIIIGCALWGGLSMCLYPLCVMHACDLAEPDRIVSTVSGLLVAWATGTIIGPMPAVAFMGLFGPPGLFIYAAIISFALWAFVTVRVRARPGRRPKGRFIDVTPTSAALSSTGAHPDA